MWEGLAPDSGVSVTHELTEPLLSGASSVPQLFGGVADAELQPGWCIRCLLKA
ncbi:hypothetical protein C4K02_3124 [Pseudomonas synxantha]|nr:hypothetical protein C4K02_3124 [Pseudomonas synxantha]